ncbi:penicillin-binding protein 2 [Synechococcus sp. CS-1325]|uniref:penicillin-binding protein 2 n=1 Tax=unclassified Synechococcus TaxID=2626047 RepID=UPI000DB347B0|nr:MULTISPECIES: penicillin-binding protein 2 [unclassified Synechococcus]PZV01910.1 MAG: penicillin-binding protein 2 [Cyanobium sp.]MCT0199136.1 penicillin-binding protein 2 [Synechococcus sp. CS-1325]MCT0214685.1 penicillin-binding protein 2 [Synechococcus sp. CS-1326]MCT0231125.1 penicillin-binding protein 2 [Synechococcus sp. CS-1324]MCT0234019.1 penicillin-binding protein 2 [Synechococcus sp. CS-1327]
MGSGLLLGQSRQAGMRHQPAWLLGLVLLVAAAMGARLAWLQLVHGTENRVLADQNRIRLVPRHPMRGRLLDRHGEVLATNRITYNLYLRPLVVTDERWQQLRGRLADVLGVPVSQLESRRRSGGQGDGYRIALAGPLSSVQVLRFKEQAAGFDGIDVDVDYLRSYPQGRLAAHVLGYTSSINEEEYNRLESSGYRVQDRIGRSGLERVFEGHLRGEWGGQQLEVNAAGEVQRVLGDKQARAGRDLRLTIDLELQRAAERALDGVRKGAIVAMDPQTGAILAMASRPNFDPNVFSAGPTTAQWNELNRPEAPMLDRALQAFPPASTFKVISSLAGLESGRYEPGSTIPTSSSFCYDGQCYADHGSFGSIGFAKALAVSSNSFFYRLGLKVGATELFKASRRLGFGSPTGIELNEEESPGLLGDRDWKRRTLKEDWTSVDTITSSIGQGAVAVTPLQMARLYAAIANGGWLVTPHLVDRPMSRQWLGLKPSTLAVLRQGLREVVTQGTATLLNIPGLPPVAGKTGTAEDPPRQDHAWFGGYAPAEKPNLVIIAFGENSGGYGGTVAAPMVKALMTTWFRGAQPTN